MVNFNNATLTAKVNSFVSEFGAHTQLIRYGQFYITNRLIEDAIGIIQTTLQTNPIIMLTPGLFESAMAEVRNYFYQPASTLNPSTFRTLMTNLNLPPELNAILAPTPAASDEVRQLYNMVWGNTEVGAGPPWLGSHPTIDKIKAAAAYEKDKCFPVLRALAAKLLKKRGVALLHTANKISEGAMAGAVLQGPAPDGTNPVPQQTIRHNNPAALPSIYAKMRAAIDMNAVVQCGVLSGVSHEHSAFPTPEHYVMPFTYGTLDGLNVFLAWDPDAGASNFRETTWGSGITCLFALPDRLSTAIDAPDLIGGIETNKFSPAFGDHLAHKARHCYQVYYVQTLPL